MNDKVVTFPGAEPLPENLLQVTDKDPWSHCAHGRITLDAHQRTVNCRDCGRVLDAFQFLETQAALLQRAWSHHAAAQRKLQELTDRISALKKEHDSLQGKVRRLKDKLPVVDVRGKDRP
jgi:peptidoglycan hydrolase CwlO-like protein